MATDAQLLDWLNAWQGTNLLRHAQIGVPWKEPTLWDKRRGIRAFLDVQADVLGREVQVRVGITLNFPDVLPHVQLLAADSDLLERTTAHLEGDGNICFTATREMVFDPERPLELLEEALKAALNTLENSWTSPNNNELLDEFGSYWFQAQPDSQPLRSLEAYFTPDDQLRQVHAWRRADERPKDSKGRALPHKKSRKAADLAIVAVADDPSSPQAFDRSRSRTLGRPQQTALYIPLGASPDLLPPRPGRPWSAEDLRRIVRGHLSLADLVQLDGLLMGRRSARDLVILGIPRPSGTGLGRRSAVAVRLSGMKGGHVLLASGATAGVKLAMQSVLRRDRAFLMQRGGSNDQLSEQRVLLLGCGALGGHLAFMLAAAGVGHLTLVDHDTFSRDNTFRHVLGQRFVGHPKVKGMAGALHERYPYLEVTPCFERTTRVVAEGRVDLAEFDLIVDATGSATHHLSLARLLKERDRHPPVLLSWLEALGLGGHTATVFHGQPGCPRCLYSDPRAQLWNVAAFSAPGQDLGRDALGCGSYFTPFSDLDAIQTAEFTARRAVAILCGQETRNLLHSWKGDPTAFLAAGHDLSKRFKGVKRRHLRAGVAYAHPACLSCGGQP